MGPLSTGLPAASLLTGAGTSASQPLGWSGDPARPGAPRVQHLSPQVEDVAAAVESLVAERAQDTQVVLGTDALFAFDPAELPPQAQDQLAGVVAEIQERRPASVLGAGHTDGLGGDDDDQDLSERRAAAVASVLADLAGAGPSFEQAGYGTTRPLLPEVTPAGEDAPSARARDRRVDITLVDGVSWPTVVPDGDVVRETSALRS